TSQDARVGYEDFTCTKSVSLSENNTYLVSIIAYGQNPQDARIYIDYNNNGTFELNELVFTKLGTINPGGNFTVPAGVVKHTPLRLRVIVDSQGNPGGPCT